MSDRSLIFNAKGVQIGYIEADRAFDLTGRERCKYARATGNLSELNSEKIVGHVSLDGTFAGLSWISDELFGKPSGEIDAGRTIRNQRPRYRPKKANPQRPENSGVKEPRDVTPPTATPSPQPENAVEGSRPFARSEKAADEAAGLEGPQRCPHDLPSCRRGLTSRLTWSRHVAPLAIDASGSTSASRS